MASGTLGISNPAASTWTSVYTVPATFVATANIRLTNLSPSTPVVIRLAIGNAAGAPASNGEYIETIDYSMEGGEIIENIGIVIGPGGIVKAFASNTNLAVRVHGFEALQ